MLPYLFLAEVHYLCVIFLYEVKCIFNGFGVGYWGNVCQGNRWIWKVSVIVFNERMSNILYQMRLTFRSDFLFLKVTWKWIKISLQREYFRWNCALEYPWIQRRYSMHYLKGSVWWMFKYTVKSLIFPKRNAITKYTGKNLVETDTQYET